MLDRVAGELGRSMNPQPIHQRRLVKFHGFGRNLQDRGNLLDGPPFGHQLEHLALTAPDGEVFDVCEGVVIERGRLFQSQVLGEAVARRVAAAEKKGRRSASANADEKKKTAAPKPGT